MGFDEFQVKASAFDRYYDEFLQNMMRGRKYQVVLTSGEAAIGVPSVGSIANPNDPNVAFSFRTGNDQSYRIPFAALRGAAPIGERLQGIVRTVSTETHAAGDLVVLVSPVEGEAALIADGDVQITALLEHSSQFQATAPAGYYKFISIEGRDLRLKSITTSGPGRVVIVAAPE